MCFLWFHNWGKWEDIPVKLEDCFIKGTYVNCSGQRRYCKDCGKKQVRVIY